MSHLLLDIKYWIAKYLEKRMFLKSCVLRLYLNNKVGNLWEVMFSCPNMNKLLKILNTKILFIIEYKVFVVLSDAKPLIIHKQKMSNYEWEDYTYSC